MIQKESQIGDMERISKRKNCQWIERDLRNRIQNGEWNSGQKLNSCRELAAHYSCSINTVGKALRNLESSGLIIRTPRKGILVNESAGAQKKAKLVAAFVPQIDNHLWMSALRGIEDSLYQHGCSMISGSHDLSSEKLRQTFENLQNFPVDGIIISPLNQNEEERQWFRNLIETWLNQNVKVVLIDRYIPDLITPYVTTDNINASYKLTRCLLENGHRTLAFVASSKYITSVEERYTGFCQACGEAGLSEGEFFNFRIHVEQEDFRQEYDSFSRQLAKYLEKHPVTALFAANDQIAKVILLTLKRLGKSVPEDISLVSYDVDNLLHDISRHITGIRQNFYEMGQMSANILLDQLASPNAQGVQFGTIIPSEVVIGDSVAPPKSKG